MKLWLVTGYCGDYYCEEDHPIAVATTLSVGEELALQARDMANQHGIPSWPRVDLVEVDVDVLLPSAQR